MFTLCGAISSSLTKQTCKSVPARLNRFGAIDWKLPTDEQAITFCFCIFFTHTHRTVNCNFSQIDLCMNMLKDKLKIESYNPRLKYKFVEMKAIETNPFDCARLNFDRISFKVALDLHTLNTARSSEHAQTNHQWQQLVIIKAKSVWVKSNNLFLN